MATWNQVLSTGSVSKTTSDIKELAMYVMALMSEDEKRLKAQVKKLIKKHKSLAAQILTTDVDGWTPVHACALRGKKKLLKLFLSSGIDVNIRMGEPEGLPKGCTLLHMSALRGDVKHLDYLLSRGADVNAIDSCDMTPIMYAAKRRHRRAYRLLEENGANMEGVEFPAQLEPITPQAQSAKFCFF